MEMALANKTAGSDGSIRCDAWNVRFPEPSAEKSMVCPRMFLGMARTIRTTLEMLCTTLEENELALKKESRILHRIVRCCGIAHRRDSVWRSADQVDRCIRRFVDMQLIALLSSMMAQFPSSSSRRFFNVPSHEHIEFLIHRILGAAQLLVQTRAYCMHSLVDLQSRLRLGNAAANYVLLMASLSRLLVVCCALLSALQDPYQNLLTFYGCIEEPTKNDFPADLWQWLGLANQEETIQAKPANIPSPPAMNIPPDEPETEPVISVPEIISIIERCISDTGEGDPFKYAWAEKGDLGMATERLGDAVKETGVEKEDAQPVLVETKIDETRNRDVLPVVEETDADNMRIGDVQPVVQETEVDSVRNEDVLPVVEETDVDNMKNGDVQSVVEEMDADNMRIGDVQPVVEETDADNMRIGDVQSVMQETEVDSVRNEDVLPVVEETVVDNMKNGDVQSVVEEMDADNMRKGEVADAEAEMVDKKNGSRPAAGADPEADLRKRFQLRELRVVLERLPAKVEEVGDTWTLEMLDKWWKLTRKLHADVLGYKKKALYNRFVRKTREEVLQLRKSIKLKISQVPEKMKEVLNERKKASICIKKKTFHTVQEVEDWWKETRQSFGIPRGAKKCERIIDQLRKDVAELEKLIEDKVKKAIRKIDASLKKCKEEHTADSELLAIAGTPDQMEGCSLQEDSNESLATSLFNKIQNASNNFTILADNDGTVASADQLQGEAATGDSIGTEQPHTVWSISVAPDGQLLLLPGEDEKNNHDQTLYPASAEPDDVGGPLMEDQAEPPFKKMLKEGSSAQALLQGIINAPECSDEASEVEVPCVVSAPPQKSVKRVNRLRKKVAVKKLKTHFKCVRSYKDLKTLLTKLSDDADNDVNCLAPQRLSNQKRTLIKRKYLANLQEVKKLILTEGKQAARPKIISIIKDVWNIVVKM